MVTRATFQVVPNCIKNVLITLSVFKETKGNGPAMKTNPYSSAVAGLAVAVFFGMPHAHSASIVNVNATGLGLTDGDAIASVANSGSAGQFSTVTGNVTAASHPANNNAGVMIQGLGFNNGGARTCR